MGEPDSISLSKEQILLFLSDFISVRSSSFIARI